MLGNSPAFEEEEKPATFVVSRNGDVFGDLQVDFEIAGTAIESDYELRDERGNLITIDETQASVVIPEGETQVEVTLTPVDDTELEGVTPETLELKLADIDRYAVSTEENAIALEIIDNDIAYYNRAWTYFGEDSGPIPGTRLPATPNANSAPRGLLRNTRRRRDL